MNHHIGSLLYSTRWKENIDELHDVKLPTIASKTSIRECLIHKPEQRSENDNVYHTTYRSTKKNDHTGTLSKNLYLNDPVSRTRILKRSVTVYEDVFVNVLKRKSGSYTLTD